MEIHEYLAAARRRLWILLLVPLLAAGAVAALVLTGPERNTATATVAAPALVGGSSINQYSGTGGVSSFVANLTAAATSDRIRGQVAEATGEPAGAIEDGLVVGQVGQSSTVDVTYTSTHHDRAVPVAGGVASEAIRFLFSTQVTLAQQTSAQAQKEVDKADADVASFYKRTMLVLPDKTFEIKSQQIAALQQRQLDLSARGEITSAARLGPSITARRKELAALVPYLVSYRTLVDRQTRATQRLGTAEQTLQQATAQASAADPRTVVTTSAVVHLSKLPDAIRKTAAAGGAGLFLAVAFVMLLELLRRPRPAVTEAPAEAPAPAVATPVPAKPTTPEPAPQAPAKPAAASRLNGGSTVSAKLGNGDRRATGKSQGQRRVPARNVRVAPDNPTN